VNSVANWSVAEGTRDGHPVIVRFVNDFPNEQTRHNYRWLTVISWKYSPDQRGMPEPSDTARMKVLEDIIESSLEAHGTCMQVISRTGNGMREWSYYIRDRDEFIDALNTALAKQPKFPIEINFFEDSAWRELSHIQNSVAK
jgi:hypothetical protein